MDLKNPIFFETPRLRKFYEHNFGLLTDSQSNKQVQDLISSGNKTTLDKDLFSQLLEDSNEKQTKHMPMATRCQEKQSSDNKQYKGFLNTVHHLQRHPQPPSLQPAPRAQQPPLTSASKRDPVRKSSKQIKKRKRKSNLQIQLLQQEFISEVEWTKDKITEVSRRTNLSESQVYKWCWDQKKKQNQDFQQEEQHIIDWHNRQKTGKHDHSVTKKLLFN